MLVIQGRNVNSIFFNAIRLILNSGVERPSRNGPTIEVPVPVSTVYERPMERVLFSKERDANPFFHFFEGLWMLAGRNDVAFPAALVKRMKVYSDDGVTQHGAYGYRWRMWFGFDQVREIIKLFQEDPETRRAVLTMWTPTGDMVPNLSGGGLLGKDIPCNTHVYFKLRPAKLNAGLALHMTVCNRSNDALWGAYGANVVHMSMLQQYVAESLGASIGPYVQMSDSLHVYTTGPGGEVWERVKQAASARLATSDHYAYSNATATAMLTSPGEREEFDADLAAFFRMFDEGRALQGPLLPAYATRFFNRIAVPMWNAWLTRDPKWLDLCSASDWALGGRKWINRHPGKEA